MIWDIIADWALEGCLPLCAYSSMVPTTIAPPDMPIEHGNFIPGVVMPQWKIPFTSDRPSDRRPLDSEPLLYNRVVDPGQRNNLWGVEQDQARRMTALMRDTLAAYDAPAELFTQLRLNSAA